MEIESAALQEIRLYSKERFDEISNIKVAREVLGQKDFLSASFSLLLGEKGIGKTVLSKQYALSQFPRDDTFSKRVLYVSMDHTPVARYNMYDLAKAFRREGGELIVFDEAHHYKNWDTDLKTIADTLKIKVIVTGSSLMELRQGVSGLSRRVVEYRLSGMSFREYAKIAKGIELPPLSFQEILDQHETLAYEMKRSLSIPILGLFDDYLQMGYYVYHLDWETKQQFFKTLVQSVESSIQKDLVLTEQINPVSVRKIQSLFYLLSKNVPYTVNYSDLQNMLNIPQLKTLKQYLAILESVGMIRSLYPARLKELKKPEKIYLANTNVYYAFAMHHLPDMGSVREVFALTALNLAGMKVNSVRKGDFVVNDRIVLEVGGKSKTMKQISKIPNSYVIKADIEVSTDPRIIPMWLLGLLDVGN